MKIRTGAASDIGRSRERNEDAYLVKEPLFAVADGMGGHRGGDVASSVVVETLSEMAIGGADDPQPLEGLVDRIQEANRRILQRGDSDRELRGMGTTLTVVVADSDRAHVAHVGDSRAYLLREGNLSQLTEDHTLVQRMVREGRLRPEEAARHPQRSILTRALGVDEDIAVDQLTLDVRPGDRLLLCTDGLTGMVPVDRIQEILEGEPDPDAASTQLVEEANRGGGEDNITVVIIDFVDDGSGNPPGTEATVQGTEAPSQAPPAEDRQQIRWGRLAVWAVALVVLIVVAFVGLRIYVGSQWYVGDADGRVAIYNGIPTRVLGLDLSTVEQVSEVPTIQATQFVTWRQLGSGITAGSLEEARGILEQIREDVAAAERNAGG
jgi:PPM family protein phosphatase